MTPIRIDDPDDPRIDAYRDIRERDLKGREGLFIAEGKVVLDVLLAARRFEVASALVLEKRLALLDETFSRLPEGTPVYSATEQVIDRIAGFHLHRGILAVGRRRDVDVANLLSGLPPAALVVVLIGIANHDNVGAIFRNCAAFGADAVLLDATCCDPLYRKAIRVSVGAALKVPFAIAENAAQLIATLSASGFDQYALSPAGRTEVGNLQRRSRTAVYFGAEGEGLPKSVLDRLTTVRIRMAPGFDSLNVAAASAITLHRLSE